MKWYKTSEPVITWTRISKCPTERTMSDLEGLLEDEYDTVTFHSTATACPICEEKDNEEIPLDKFISDGQEHSAPIFHLTHPGCTCSVSVSGPEKDEVELDYSGII